MPVAPSTHHSTPGGPNAGIVGAHATAEMFYPSIAAWAPGRWIGLLLNSIPVPVGRHRLSMLLFGLPIAPLAAGLYLLQKAIGVRYRITGKSVEQLPMIGDDVKTRVALEEIADASVMVRPGQAFHRAGDVSLRDASGQELLLIEGIPRPERVCAAIFDVRESLRQIRQVRELVSVRPSVEELKAQAAAEAAAKKAEAAKKAAAAAKEGDAAETAAAKPSDASAPDKPK